MTPAFRVEIFTHYFCVSRFDRTVKTILMDYAKEFAEYDSVYNRRSGRMQQVVKRMFAASTDNRQEMRFHIFALEEFYEHFKRSGYKKESMDIITHLTPVPVSCELPLMPSWKPYDYQIPIIERGTQLNEVVQGLVMAGGLGKTSVALAIASRLGVRLVIVLRGMYVDRWELALIEHTRVLDIAKEDYMITRGAKDMIAMIKAAKAGELTEKVIIITNMTMHAFLKHYELFPTDRKLYGCLPHELYTVLGAGFRIIDEVHQDFHMNFRQDLYTHIQKSLSLSGSLKKSSSFINRMYEIAIPRRHRIGDVRKKPYCSATALFFQLDKQSKDKIRYLSARNQYSHNEFESSILKDKKLLFKYLDMIRTCWDTFFIERYEEGMKGMLFAGRVEMCDEIVETFRKEYPHLKTMRYTADDEYENLLEADIIVSTLLSAGTAVDIKDLRTVFMTTAVGSIDQNIQAFWRIRELKRYPNTVPDFIYFVCGDIPQHVEYHRIKLEEFNGYALSHKVAYVGLKL